MAIIQNWLDWFGQHVNCSPYPAMSSNPKMEMMTGSIGLQIKYFACQYPDILESEETDLPQYDLNYWYAQIQCGHFFVDEAQAFAVLAKLYKAVADVCETNGPIESLVVSTGGNGEDDEGKVLGFGNNGSGEFSESVTVRGDDEYLTMLPDGILYYDNTSSSGTSVKFLPPTVNRLVNYPDKDGTILVGSTAVVSAATASTHKIPILIDGVVYNLLATTV